MRFLDEAHAVALAVTLLSESAGMGVFSALSGAGGRRVLRNSALAACTNLVTHTVFWYTLPLLGAASATTLYAYEIIIVVIEAKLYQTLCGIPPWRAVALSFVLNLTSCMLGLYVWQRL